MIVHWEVSDGYVGGSRPQESEIPDSELEGMDEEERVDFINKWVQEDFEQSISWEITGFDDD